MSLPDLVPAPPLTRPDATAVTTILDAAAQHRLHTAMVLVGVHRVPRAGRPRAGLAADPPEGRRAARARPDRAPRPAEVELLHWRGCRQHLDRRRAGRAWRQSLRVFADETGRGYTEANADEAVTTTAARVGLPPVTFAGRELAA